MCEPPAAFTVPPLILRWEMVLLQPKPVPSPPVRVSVAPAFTVTTPLTILFPPDASASSSTPESTVVPPLYVLILVSFIVPRPDLINAAGDQFWSADTSVNFVETIRSAFIFPVTSATLKCELSVPVPFRLKNDEEEIVEGDDPETIGLFKIPAPQLL